MTDFDQPRQLAFEDFPSVAAVARSPSLLIQESLAGIVTALALIPEVISFSFISGVDPKQALGASVVMGLVMTLMGGRPAMVTAAAGSVALVAGPMVKVHGADYLLPMILLAGIIQMAFGALGFARVTRFIPRAVMIGFVNSLGILIFMAQIPHIINGSLTVYFFFALTIILVLLTPKVVTLIPPPLVAIVAATVIAIAGHLQIPDVGSAGSMAPGMPDITALKVPVSLVTLQIILPTAISVAFVGLLETLLTARLVDDLTRTRSDKARESWALGIANIAAGFYGGVAGCAMIGQTIVNVKIGGGRTRISTAAAALTLLALVTVLSGWMARIPMVALAAVMMIVALRTFNWNSLKLATLRRMPISESLVLVTTIFITTATGNLALGVATGVLLAMVVFVLSIARVTSIIRETTKDGSVLYKIYGPLFFGSSNELPERFHYSSDPTNVVIDLTHAQIWDASTVAAMDTVVQRYATHGTAVMFTGLDKRSIAFHENLTGRLS